MKRERHRTVYFADHARQENIYVRIRDRSHPVWFGIFRNGSKLRAVGVLAYLFILYTTKAIAARLRLVLLPRAHDSNEHPADNRRRDRPGGK